MKNEKDEEDDKVGEKPMGIGHPTVIMTNLNALFVLFNIFKNYKKRFSPKSLILQMNT